MAKVSYSTLAVSMPSDGVVHVELNRPDKLNAMNVAFFPEMRALFDALASDDGVRAVVLSGRGRVFSAGLDLRDAGSAPEGDDVARQAWYWRRHVLELQERFVTRVRVVDGWTSARRRPRAPTHAAVQLLARRACWLAYSPRG